MRGSETSFDIGSHMDFTDRLLGDQLESDPIWISPISGGDLGCGVGVLRWCKSVQGGLDFRKSIHVMGRLGRLGLRIELGVSYAYGKSGRQRARPGAEP